MCVAPCVTNVLAFFPESTRDKGNNTYLKQSSLQLYKKWIIVIFQQTILIKSSLNSLCPFPQYFGWGPENVLHPPPPIIQTYLGKSSLKYHILSRILGKSWSFRGIRHLDPSHFGIVTIGGHEGPVWPLSPNFADLLTPMMDCSLISTVSLWFFKGDSHLV